jgi:hypothetical protein
MLNQTRALWGIARESPLQGPGISRPETLRSSNQVATLEAAKAEFEGIHPT